MSDWQCFFFALETERWMCLWAHQEGKRAPFIQDVSGEDAFKNPGVNSRTQTCLIVIGPITAHNIMVKHEQQRQNLKKTDEKIKAPLQQHESLHKRRRESLIKVHLLHQFLLFQFRLFALFGNSFMYLIFGLSLSFCNVLIGYNVGLRRCRSPVCCLRSVIFTCRFTQTMAATSIELSMGHGHPSLSSPTKWKTHIHTQMNQEGGFVLNLRSRNSRRVSKCL